VDDCGDDARYQAKACLSLSHESLGFNAGAAQTQYRKSDEQTACVSL
jgi:hypothetical protein